MDARLTNIKRSIKVGRLNLEDIGWLVETVEKQEGELQQLKEGVMQK